jgi:hypothetical protein
VAADVVAPTACEDWSTAVIPDTVDSPEYSKAMIAMSAEDVGLAVIVAAAPPAVTGAVQMLISALSEAAKCVTSTNESLSESVTELAVALAELHTATSTTRRSPAATLAPVVTERLLLPDPCALACWTNAGVAAAALTGAAAAGTAGAAMAAVAPAASRATVHAAAGTRCRRPIAWARDS